MILNVMTTLYAYKWKSTETMFQQTPSFFHVKIKKTGDVKSEILERVNMAHIPQY